MPTIRPQPPTISCSPREPQLLHFRLRQMFVVATLFSILCALLVLTPGPWPLVIGFGTLLIAAHICGNLIGTRLGNSSQQVYRRPHPPKTKQPQAEH